MTGVSRKLLRVAICALYVACFLAHSSHAPIADEVDFMLPIEKWVTAGPQAAGVWHSPFYPWLLSLLGRVFPFQANVLRLVGLLSVLATALLLQRAARLNKRTWRTETLLVLSLLSPAALGSALTLDYDTTVLMVSTGLFFFLLVRHQGRRDATPGWLAAVFGGALILCLCSKETTPLIYPAALIPTFGPRLGWRRAALSAAGVLVVGCAGFLLAAALWCAHFAVPFGTVFYNDVHGVLDHATVNRLVSAPGSAGSSLLRSLWVKAVPLFWLGWPLAALFIIDFAALARGDDGATRPRGASNCGAARGIALVIVLVTLVYTFVLRQMTYQFPKYLAPVLPWIAWLAVTREREATGGKLSLTARLCWAGGIALWFAAAWDPLSVLYERNAHGLAVYFFVTAFPFLFWLVFLVGGWKAPSFRELALFLSLGLAAAYSSEALLSDKSITYWYGERALAEARARAEAWRARNPTGRIIAPAKDIAWVTRDLGSRYIQKDELDGTGPKLCADPSPLLVLTRVREDSSLVHAPELADTRRCLGVVVQDGDIAWGSAHAAFLKR